MSLILQPPLIRSDRRRCVLATIEDARRQLRNWGETEDFILSLLQSGALPFGWNIAANPKTRTKINMRCWRILPECIEHFDRTGGRPVFSWDQRRAFARVFEGQRDTITSRELRLMFNCSADHITALIDEGRLVQVPGTQYRVGPDGAARIQRTSVEQFLKERVAEKWI